MWSVWRTKVENTRKVEISVSKRNFKSISAKSQFPKNDYRCVKYASLGIFSHTSKVKKKKKNNNNNKMIFMSLISKINTTRLDNLWFKIT